LGATTVAENYRSMRGLERTASTSRVLNLAALSVKHADNPEHLAKPLFTAPTLNAAVILKHRLRANEIGTVSTPHRTATKLIVPFERSDLALGGRSLFVGDRGWMQQFVRAEISKLIDLAYKGRVSSDNSSSRLVEALLSSRHDERLEPLRLTLRLEGESYREGIFAWKGFLYYKWVLNSLWPKLKEVLIEVMKLRVIGPRDRDLMVLIDEMKLRLRAAMEGQVKAVMGYLKTYDAVFAQLTQGNAAAFRDFLLASPEMFMSLGEGAGTLSHVATFWRYRFPQGKPLMAPMGEILELLQDFESGLGAEPHPLSFAA
jgi:hypothetical protein